MATATQPTTMSPVRDEPRDEYEELTRGEGWLFFAASMLGIAGIMRFLDSLWAFGYHGALPEGLKNGLLGDNLRTYAWVWLGVGTLLFLSSFAVLMRSQFARWIGIIAAAVGAVTAMTWMPYYPVWSLTYVTLAVITFYALTRYGGREREAP